jgi:hypothetical protein
MAHDGSLCIIDSLSRSIRAQAAGALSGCFQRVWLESSEARPHVARERRGELKIACVVISQHLLVEVSGRWMGNKYKCQY